MADTVATIGQATFVRGNIQGAGDLTIAGRVEGSVEIDGTVIIEETGIVKSDISAQQVIVRGAVLGKLTATDAVQLEDGSRVAGDLQAPRIRIDEGALYRGRIETGQTPARQPARSAQATASAPRAVVAARPAAAPRAVAPAAAARPPVVARQAPPPAPAAVVEEPRQERPRPAPVAPPRPVQRRVEEVARPQPQPPRPAQAETTAAKASHDGPPPPVVPALKKKARGTVRKRGASE